ncbi:MAG: cytochrome P450 [Thermoleophilaceae bacterium]|nr:cytochrome P450 [Thermoleophilaceae bacterium]
MLTVWPYAWLPRVRERYGEVFTCRFPIYGDVVYVADPDAIKKVFAGPATVYHAGEANHMALGDPLGDNSLLTLDEDRHMSQRKLLLPPFHGDRVRLYAQVMAEATAREVDQWPLGEEIELRPRMQAITLEVILRAVFGVRDGERMDLFRERIPKVAEATSVYTWMPLLDRLLGKRSPAARLRRVLAGVDELIYAEIADRRRQAEPGDDVLSLLLAAPHDDGSPMSDVELRDELMTLLTAGHETTATGLSWAFERLVRTPAAMDRLVGSLDSDEYLDAVVKETLRVRPVVVDVARKLTQDTEVAGRLLPAGALVLPAIAAVHARADLYPRPGEFRPERFIDGQPESYAWIPFGGGVRRCIGAAFAQVEMRVVLREVLRRVRVRAARAKDERPRVLHVTVVPGGGARVVVTERVATGPPAASERPAALAG